MVMVEGVPPAVLEFQKVGGVLDFVFFTGADGSEATAREGVRQAIGRLRFGTPDGIGRDRVQALGWRPLTRDAFLGEWVDPASGALRHVGTWTLSNGRTLVDPSYSKLDALRRAGVTVWAGGVAVPELWEGGQFGYAFSQPPYSLRAGPGRVQELFDAVRDLVLPPGAACVIRDWGGPEVVALCPGYFEPGTEWWGVFLWTVQVPGDGTLAVVLGSSTD